MSSEQVTILCLGDPHYMKGNEDDTNILEDEFLRQIDKYNPDIIAVMGDVLDRFGNVYTPVLARAMYFLREMSEITTLFIIVGNHDRVNPSDFMSDVHPFIGCQWWKNTTVADTVKKVTVKGFRFCLVPYVPKDRYFEALAKKKVKIEDFDCFLSHQEFKGCNYGAHGESDAKDVWRKDYPLNINGHIHEYQNLGSLINVGTAYQVNFGEHEDKGLSLITLTKKNGKTTYTEERIPLKTSLKETYKIRVSNYFSWKPPYTRKEMKKRNIRISLKVKGTSAELAPLKQDLTTKQKLRKNYVYVSFQEKRRRPENLGYIHDLKQKTKHHDFKSIMWEAVKGKEELSELLEEIRMEV